MAVVGAAYGVYEVARPNGDNARVIGNLAADGAAAAGNNLAAAGHNLGRAVVNALPGNAPLAPAFRPAQDEGDD